MEKERKKKLKWSRKMYETDSSEDEDDYLDTLMRNKKMAKLMRKDRSLKRPVYTQKPAQEEGDDVAYLHNMSKARRDMLMQAVFGC